MILRGSDYFLGGVMMATSSIFANFDIEDKGIAERFVEALEESAHDPEWKPVAPIAPPLTDQEAIRALLAKRGQRKCSTE